LSIKIDKVWLSPSQAYSGDRVLVYWSWRETEGKRGTVVFRITIDSQTYEETDTVEPLASVTSGGYPITAPSAPGTYQVCVEVESWVPEEVKGITDPNVIAKLKAEGLTEAEIATIPYDTTDVLIVEGFSSWAPSGEEIARKVKEAAEANGAPEIEVTRVIVKKTGDWLVLVRRKVYVFVKSPLAPMVAVALLAAIVAVCGFLIVLAKSYFDLRTLQTKEEALDDLQTTITRILNDPNLTNEQKEALIKALTDAFNKAQQTGVNWVDLLKWGTLGGIGILLLFIILKAMEGRK
jgi:hypothetical protein